MGAVDPRLLEILVCPLCKGKLVYRKDAARARLQGRPPRLPGQGRHPRDARGRGAQAAARRRSRLDAFSVIIPARYASTRFPGKPLADLGGKPMVVRVCERAAKSGAARGACRHRRRAHRERGARARLQGGDDARRSRVGHRPAGRSGRAARPRGRRRRRQRAGRRAADRAGADPPGGGAPREAADMVRPRATPSTTRRRSPTQTW